MSEPTEWPPEVLREAKPLSLMWFPESAAAKELAAGIARDIDATFGGGAKYKRGNAKLAKLSDATGAVVAGILLAQAGDGPKSVFKAMRNDYFTGCRISLDTYRAVRQGLEGLDLIDVKDTLRFPRGFGFGGYAARMKPTPSLIALAAASGITPENVKEHFQARPNEYAPKLPRALAEVRTMQGLDPEEAPDTWHAVTPEPEGAQGRAIREEIERANERLAGHQFGGCLQPRLRRIFTTLSPAWDGRWWLGGRWYAIGPEGAYQTLPEALRAQITVDGEETVEVDVSASQLTLLMGRLGIERPPVGLYDIPGVPRPVVKQFVVQTLGNGRPVKRWRSDVAASIRAVPLEDVERAVLAVYPFLEAPYEDVMPEEMGERLMRKALTHRLMNIEAEALTTAMRLIWDAAPEAAVLPVHDSLIVARKHEGLALSALEEGYAQRCRGELPIVKRKGAS